MLSLNMAGQTQLQLVLLPLHHTAAGQLAGKLPELVLLPAYTNQLYANSSFWSSA